MAAKKRVRTGSTAMKKKEKLYNRLLYCGFFLVLVKYIFFTAVTIGYDRRYFIFIFLMPVTAGVVAMFLLWRKTIISNIKEMPGLWRKALLGLLFLAIGILCSYMSIGMVAECTWEVINRRAAAANDEETMMFPVRKFYYGKSAGVGFRFNNRSAHINCRYRDIETYRNSPPERYTIILEVQKGIWGYYIVNSWNIADTANEGNN